MPSASAISFTVARPETSAFAILARRPSRRSSAVGTGLTSVAGRLAFTQLLVGCRTTVSLLPNAFMQPFRKHAMRRSRRRQPSAAVNAAVLIGN